MKSLEYYMNLNYKVQVVKDEAEGGYVLSIPDLKGCLTSSNDIGSGMMRLEDAKKEWIKAAMEEGYEVPEPDSAENYSGQFKLRIPRSLHKELAERSRREGVSMNQYCLYLLSRHLRSARTRKKSSSLRMVAKKS